MRQKHFVALVVILSGTNAVADTVTMDELFEHVAKSHPTFKVQDYRPQLTQKSMESLIGRQDWLLEARTGYGKDKFDESSNSQGEALNSSFSAGLRKQFWSFGGSLSLTHYVNRYERDYSDPGITSSIDDYRSNLRVSLGVPLWNNFGGIQTRSFYDRLEFDLRIDQIAILEVKENILRNVGHDYLVLVQLLQNELISHDTFISAMTLLEYIDAKGETDSTVSIRDKNHTRRFLAEVKHNKDTIRKNLTQNRIELASYLMFDKLKTNDPIPNKFPSVGQQAVDELVAKLLNNSRELQILKIGVEQQEHSKTVAENDTNPNLNFSVSADASGSDNELDDSYNKESHGYDVGLNFSYPIGNTSANARLESANISRMRLNDSYRDTELQLESSLRSIYQELTELSSLLETSGLMVKLATENIQSEFAAYKKGNVDIVLYIESIREEASARLQHTNNMMRYQHVYLDYLALSDRLWTTERDKQN